MNLLIVKHVIDPKKTMDKILPPPTPTFPVPQTFSQGMGKTMCKVRTDEEYSKISASEDVHPQR